MWKKIGQTNDVLLNKTKVVQVDQYRLILIRTNKGLFILEDKCPHQEQTLKDGEVSDNSIECPWHSVKIELSSGKVINNMGFLGLPQVRTFACKEENGEIWVELPNN